MRLSEAIRLGSLAIQNPRAGDARYCAVGMACKAIGKLNMERESANYRIVSLQWPWTTQMADTHNSFLTLVWYDFDTKVCKGKMTLEALCDQVRAWENELESKGVSVEQVTMAATPETTSVPASEHIPEVEVVGGGA